MTHEQASPDSDRREFARLRPKASAREISVMLQSERQVTGLIEDFSRGGLGFVVTPDAEIRVDADLTIQYHDLCLKGRVANLAETPQGFVRIGLEWERPIGPQNQNGQSSENDCPRIIVVKDADDGNLYLQQSREEGTESILISTEQLEKIVGYLAGSELQKSAEMSLDGPSESNILIRVFSSDKSFSISQGTKYIWGSGDINGILSLESDTHPIG